MNNQELRMIDLFSGAGGLTVGFEWLSERPFRAVWANDFNEHAARSYNANFDPVCRHGDIVDILRDPATEIPPAELVVGGPPCQGFSLLNKQRADDPRKKLWIPFMEVIDRSGARLFVMENVPQLLGSLEHQEILEWAGSRGFAVWSGVLLAADYGVPQTRRRAIIVGSKDLDPAELFPPPRTHYRPDEKAAGATRAGAAGAGERATAAETSACACASASPSVCTWRTVRDAVGDLPAPEGTEIREAEPPLDLHFGRNPTAKSVARYRAIPEQGMNRVDLQKRAPELTPACWLRKKSGGTDLFGRLWWDRPAFTIRTEFFKPEKGRYLHPEQHRPITHREAARFQSFPDAFRFLGTKIEIARQIGNAVPPLLAKAIAERVYQLWEAAGACDTPRHGQHHGHLHRAQTAGDHVSSEESRHPAGAVG